MAIDIHFMKDGKFHQSWHIEDFASGIDQALNGAPPPDFGFDDEYVNFQIFFSVKSISRIFLKIKNFIRGNPDFEFDEEFL